MQEKRFSYTAGPRRTFEQNLEFYPVTRRAWNRAVGNLSLLHYVAIRKAELEELKTEKTA